MKRDIRTVDPEQLAGLRRLRLYHWQAGLRARSHGYDKSANMHLRFVQTLNDFFEQDDTAERDAG